MITFTLTAVCIRTYNVDFAQNSKYEGISLMPQRKKNDKQFVDKNFYFSTKNWKQKIRTHFNSVVWKLLGKSLRIGEIPEKMPT